MLVARYFFDLVGVDADDIGVEYRTFEDARAAAVTYLGEYLQDHPSYANAGHWQVDVYNAHRSLVMNVIVATINAPASRTDLWV